MRPLLAALLAVVILGSVQLFLLFQAQVPVVPAAQRLDIAAAGQFDVEVTLTFDAGPDPFDIIGADPPAAFVLQLGGVELLRRMDAVAAGQPLRIEDVDGLVVGDNEFYLRAAPADQGDTIARAVRVRIFRDGQAVADQTMWSPPGDIVEGPIRLTIPAATAIADDGDHAGHVRKHQRVPA